MLDVQPAALTAMHYAQQVAVSYTTPNTTKRLQHVRDVASFAGERKDSCPSLSIGVGQRQVRPWKL